MSLPERVSFDSSYLNSSSVTRTRTRVKDVSPTSGMCGLCTEDCVILCEIGLSALRGREVLYPDPEYFGRSTAAAIKNYGLDWSHLVILPSVGGVETEPTEFPFEKVSVSVKIAGIPLKIPVFLLALGSTKVAKRYWTQLTVGSAISGVIQIIGENVAGMDDEAVFSSGKVVKSPELKRRVSEYRRFWDGKHGDIAVQTNIEDQMMGVDEYAISNLEVNIIERKWGQGAKAIGGEVRISDLEKAIRLKKRGYMVFPDPEDRSIQEAFRRGVIKTFERHSRVKTPTLESFMEDVEKLRERGAKKIFLKTGSYRPASIAFTLRAASEAKIDVVTFDGAGGGTGMSPVSMMNEMGVPTVYLAAQVIRGIKVLREKGRHVPDVVIAGGFINETQFFKAIAMSNFDSDPFFKAVGQARAPLTAVMKTERYASLAIDKKLPESFAVKYGKNPEQFITVYHELAGLYGEDIKKMPWGAIGLYNYWHSRIKTGLKQLVAGVRKLRINEINRRDLATLSTISERVTGIPLIDRVDEDVFENILIG